MSKYPDIITDAILEQNEHISDSEIRKDIADTKREIEQAEIAIAGYEAEAQLKSMPYARMARFRADGHRQTNQERRELIVFLEKLLDARMQIDAPSVDADRGE